MLLGLGCYRAQLDLYEPEGKKKGGGRSRRRISRQTAYALTI